MDRWTDELAKQEATAEVKALAEEFSKTAKKIVEPKPEDVINAAKTYFVAKRIMAAENCQGISLNCLGLVAQRGRFPARPAWPGRSSTTKGSPASASATGTRGSRMRLCSLLCGRPGFQQDPAPNTVNGTLMGAHCTSATKLRGFDQPAVPMILRSHSESGLGVSPQVLWPVGEPVTVMTFQGPAR